MSILASALIAAIARPAAAAPITYQFTLIADTSGPFSTFDSFGLSPINGADTGHQLRSKRSNGK